MGTIIKRTKQVEKFHLLKGSGYRCMFFFILLQLLLCSFSGYSQTINKTRVTGAINWNTASNWIQMRTGTATFTNGSATVTGVGTSFTTELQVGDALMLDATYASNYATVQGVVASIESNTSLTLVAQVTGNPTTPGAYGRQMVPGSGDDVQIGNTALATPAVTLTLDISASINSLTFLAQNVAHSLTHSGSNALTLAGNASINQPTANTLVNAWIINAGSATIGGNLGLNVTSSTSSRVARVATTSGSLTVAGNIVYTNTQQVLCSVIDMSGGAGTLTIGGSITLSSLGTLTPGTSSTVIYNGTGAQTITNASGISYNNLTINKASGTASLMANTVLPGNVVLQSGTLSASASNFNLTVNGNWTNSGGTYSGGTGNVTLAGVSGTISGTTAFPNLIIDGASTTAYTMSGNNSCASLTFSTGNFASSLTHTGSSALTVNGAVSLNQPGTGPITNAWNINAGSATVSGLISFLGTNTGVTRIARLVITTGTLNANGGITFAGSANATKEIDMSGGAGVLNLKGALTVPSNSGTLTAGTAGSIFNYADDANAQTVNFFSAGAYHNLRTNNTHASGATLSAAITTANVTNNFRVLTGTLSNGGFAITLNAGKIFEIANGATFRMTGTSSMVTGSGITKTFGATSTCDYAGTTQSVSDEAYGHLIISGSGTKTAVAALSVTGTLTVNASCNLNLTTFALSGSITSVAGSGIIQTQNTSASPITSGRTWSCGIDYNAAAGGQTIVAGTYTNLTNSNTSNTNTVAGNIVVNGILTMNTGSVMNMGSFAMSGSLTSITGAGILRTQSTSATPLPSGKTWTGTVDYNNATGGQSIVAGTYTNLINNNTSNVNTAVGAFSVSGTLTLTAGGTLNMGTNALSAATTLAGTGNIRTQNTSATPIPTGKTWIGSVEYNNATGGQTVVLGTYAALLISNTSGSQTAAGVITISAAGSLAISAGAVLDMSTFALLGATMVPSGTGTLRTQNIATTAPFAIPVNTNWTFTVAYTSASAQWVVEGTYTNLDLTGGNRSVSDNGITNISGVFTPGAGVITVNNSIINFTGNNQTIPPMVYEQVYISGAGTKLYPTGTSTIKGLTVQSGGVLQVSGGSIYLNANSYIVGILNMTGGTILCTNDFRISPGGVINQSNGVIHLAASIGSFPSDHLKIDAGGTVNQTGGTMHVKDYTSSPGTFNQNGASALFMVYHDFKPGTGSVFYSTAGTVQFTGNGSSNMAAGSRQFNHMIVNAGAEPKFYNTANSVIPVSGNFTNNNTALTNTTSSTFIFNGDGNQTIYSASTGSTFGHVTFDNPDYNITITSDIGVAGSWTVLRNTPVILGSNTVRFSGVTETINGSTAFGGINLTATSGIYTMNADNSCTSLSMDASGVAGGLTQSGSTNLHISGDVTINQPTASVVKSWNINAGSATVGGTVSLGGVNTTNARISRIALTTGTLTINGNLVYNSPAATPLNAVVDLNTGASTLNLKGSIILSNGTGTLATSATSAVYYNGTGAQTVNGGSAISYFNLYFVKPSGIATLGSNIAATNVFLNQGQLSGAASFVMTIAGDWTNNGGTAINAPIATFTGTTKIISGAGTTDFGALTFANGSTYTISNTNTCTGLSLPATSLNTTLTQTSSSNVTVNGNVTLNQPTTSGITNNWNLGAGTATVNGNINIGGTNTNLTRIAKLAITTGTLHVNGNVVYNSSATANTAATAVVDMSGGAGIMNLKGNLTLTNGTGTLTPGTSSTVNFNGITAQSVSFASQIKYNNIFVNNPAIVTVSGAVSSTNVSGDIRVQSGIFDNGGFAIAGAAGKTFEVVNGATFRISATSGMVTVFAKSFAVASTVEYSGGAQTVSAENYGHLIFSGNTGAVVKTMPVTAFTVGGNFTSTLGTASSVSYTAGAAININGHVNIGTNTSFTSGAFVHTVGGNWLNNGTYTTTAAGTLTLTGNNTTISGSSSHNFGNLQITGTNVNTTATLTVTGNLTTASSGTFNQNAGTATFSGITKVISGAGIKLNDAVFTGSISTAAELLIAGNLSVNSGGSFTGTDGAVTMSGSSKSITNSGTLSFFNITSTGTITTASSFTVSSYMDVTAGSITASAGTITFTGTSTFDGTSNLYNVTINGTSLTLASNALLGIANLITKTAGILDVTTATPNTVIFNGITNKNIEAGTFHNLIFDRNTNTATGTLIINGDLTIRPSTIFTASTFTHTILGDWTNNGTFNAGTGTIQFSGDDDANIYGATTFNLVTINNSSSENIIHLWSDISVSTINMQSGGLYTRNNTLTISTTRTGNGIIMGTIKRTHSFSSGVNYEFEGPNNTIFFTSVTGVNSVTVKVTEGAVVDFPFGGSINRLYELTVPAGTYTGNLKLHYENAELNGNSESTMVMWKYNGTSWATVGKTANDTILNYVQLNSLTDIAGKWTCSDDNHVIRWNGAVSSDWTNPNNWTAVQGIPSRPPTAGDIVQIGYINYTYAPIITSAAQAKNISFGSTKASTLSLSAGGSLTVQGNINGSWSGNAIHTINVNGQNLTVNGDVQLSDGTASHAINLNISTGSLSLTGSLTQSGGANIVFSGAGNLTVGQNYTYVSGTFTRSTGTVTYNGAAAQLVAPVNYNNLTITKASGIATLATTATVSGNLLVNSGEFNINASATVTGNMTLASGAILKTAAITLSVGGNWFNAGSFIPSSGTVTFNGTGAQSISASPFNTLTINKSAGTATAIGNLAIAGNLTISTGSLDLGSFTANRNSGGGVLTISAGAGLLLAGADNFPANFTTNTLASTSTVTFNGTVAQTVPVKTYGNLVFSNGAANAKTFAGSFTANGNITINSGATVACSSHTLTLAGNWTNSGSFTASTGTVRCTGIFKTITGATTFNIFTVSGSYTVAGTDITCNGLFTVQTGGSISTGTGLLTIAGDFTNNGSFSSTGTVSFPGTQVQNIQYVNATTTSYNIANFNGTVAPVFTSNSSPTFNTLNINNTGGVSATISWYVNTAFNVAVGSNFNGNNAAHYFYGSFTNNGTISSSGTLHISPATTQTILLRGTSFSSTGTVVFGGSGAMTVNGVPNTITHVIIGNSVGVTPSANWSMAGNFSINNNSIFNAGSYSYIVAGDIQSSGTLNAGTSLFTMTAAAGSLAGSTNTTFYDLTISGNIIVNADYNVARHFTNNGTYNGSGGRLIMTGATAATIGGTASPFTLAQLTVQKNAGVAATVARNITNVTNLVVTSGILDASTFSITQDATNGGILLLQNTGTLKIGGTNTLPAFNDITIGDATTVEYYGSTQTVTSVAPVGKTYGNLVISSAGTKTANGALNIKGNISITTATFVPGAFIDTLAGNWTQTSGAFTNTGNTLVLNGSSNQTINANTTFNHITVNKLTGSVLLASDVTLAGTLSFTSGLVTTGSFTLITTSGTVSGASQSTGWVNGSFRRSFSAGILTGLYPLGGVNNYTPFSLNFGSITTGGAITGTTSGVHPQLGTSGITLDKNIARTWTVTNTGGVTFNNYAITLNWNASQNYNEFDSTLLKVSLYSSSIWSVPVISGTPTSTSLVAGNNTIFGDFIVGERCDVNGTFSYAANSYCTNGANASVILAPGSTAGVFSNNPAGLSINTGTGLINVSLSAPRAYTVSNTVTGTGGCKTTAYFALSVVAPPLATISYTGGPFCTNSGTIAVSRTGTNNGVYSSTTGLTINATSGLITPATSTPGTYTVTYTVAAANGCAQFQTTTQVIIRGEGYWTGTSSTNWLSGSNWQCGTVPSAGINIVIPTGASFYPQVAVDTVTINNLTIQTGASLSVSSGKIKIAGSISNSGTFNVSNGMVEMNGSSQQSIPAAAFVSNQVQELHINNTAGVVLNGQLNLLNVLKIQNGSITTNGYLTLKSTATMTAQVAQITSSNPTPVIGNVTVERYILGRRKYRLITSSVTTSNLTTLPPGQEAASIWGHWQMAGSTAMQNQGTSITGGTSADGFDQITTNASLFSYDDVNRTYRAWSTANGKNTKYTPLKAGVAYFMFVYGDRQNSAGATSPRPTVLKATGTLLTGDQNYTTSSANPLSNTTDRFTMLGNPFAAPVNWATIPKTNLSNTTWLWDPNLNGTGGYVTVTTAGNITLSAPYSGSVGLNQYIQPGQGFFVKTIGANPTMTIRESDKVNNNNNIAFFTGGNENNLGANQIPLIAVNLLYPSGATNILADGTLAAFDNSFSNEVDDADAEKMMASTEGIGINKNNRLLSVEARKFPTSEDTIQLDVSRLTRAQYSLQIFANQMTNSVLTAYLQDNFLNTTQILSLTDTNRIVFNVTSGVPASSAANRFKIIFRDAAVLPVKFVSVKASQKNKDIQVAWLVAEESSTVKYQVEHSTTGTAFSIAGELVARGIAGNQDYQWLDILPAVGNHFYRIKAINADGKFVLSSIVQVKIEGTTISEPGIKVYPNPVKNHEINLILSNLTNGKLPVQVINMQGQVVHEQNIFNNGSTTSQIITLSRKITTGIYYLIVLDNEKRYSFKIQIE